MFVTQYAIIAFSGRILKLSWRFSVMDMHCLFGIVTTVFVAGAFWYKSNYKAEESMSAVLLVIYALAQPWVLVRSK